MTTVVIDRKNGLAATDSLSTYTSNSSCYAIYKDNEKKVIGIKHGMLLSSGSKYLSNTVAGFIDNETLKGHFYASVPHKSCTVFLVRVDSGEVKVYEYDVSYVGSWEKYFDRYKYKVTCRLATDSVIFAGSGGEYAKNYYDVMNHLGETYDPHVRIKNSVKYAITKDPYSGGDVVVYDIK